MKGASEKNGKNSEREILIVGGSLSGLTCALACARYGVRTRIVERVEARNRSGGGLGVDRKLLATVTGIDPRLDGELPHLPVVTSYRESTAWLLLHDWLRGYALRDPLITIEEGVLVTEVRQTAEAGIAVTADGTEIMAPAILGADGYRSVVRRAVNPDELYASYAGYMLWRGLVSERMMSRSTRWPRDSDGLGMIDTAGYRLIAYPVPGKDGSLIPGERQMNFVWYDITRDDLLREKGCLSPEGYVLSTLNNEHIPPAVLEDLARVAGQIWMTSEGVCFSRAETPDRTAGDLAFRGYPGLYRV